MTKPLTDKELWSLAKQMFKEQTADLPVRSWETSTPETRVQWRKAAQFVHQRALERRPQTRVDKIVRCLDTIETHIARCIYSGDRQRLYILDERFAFLIEVLREEKEAVHG